jgi:hypothetical protein
MPTLPIAGVQFTDATRPVYADGERQYVHDDAGEWCYGVWGSVDVPGRGKERARRESA